MRSTDKYDSLFWWFGEQYNISWKLLKAQVRAESNFDPNACSMVDACGLAQFMVPTFAEWSAKLKIKNPDIFNPEHSIWCQAAYMRWLLDRFNQDMDLALASYNWGIGNVRKVKGKTDMQLGKDWRELIPQETREYLRKIKVFREEI